MTTTEQVKIGFHGNSYWLLWHWEVLTPTTATYTAAPPMSAVLTEVSKRQKPLASGNR
ncbi:MAG TPA: hypothetical protein VNO32_19740 [Candidatus Acidoferrum sp.]|jgi:hypothetical protein|nr:hypothetical protein [Candidatus Acidoferrum sp.]